MCLAVPGRLIEVKSNDELAREGVVDFEGVRKTVNITFTPDAVVGDYLLVHVGFSIGTVDEEQAARTLNTLRELGEVEDEEDSWKEDG